MKGAKITAYGNYRYLSTGYVELPDDAGYDSRQDFIDRGALHIQRSVKDIVHIEPLHVYNHSGISFSTDMSGNYACRWDSGTCGFVYVTKQSLRDYFHVKRLSQKHLDQAEQLINDLVYELNVCEEEIYDEDVAD